MDFVSLIHQPNSVTDPIIAKPVIEALRHAVYKERRAHLTDEELAIFFIILGGELLVWEDA
jgi:hypothetical protein